MDNERIVIGRETDHVGRLHVSQEDILGRTIYLPPHSMRCFHVRRRLTTLSGELETGLYPRFTAEGSLVLPQWMTFMPRLMGSPWLVSQ